jgi:DNA-directed RNA polymerase specialized sigma24 family protein
MANPQWSRTFGHFLRLESVRFAGVLSDAELLERFLNHRDEAAFEALTWRHGAMVLRVCRRILNNLHDAEDPFQATFLVLFRKARSIGKMQALAAWLHRVAYRVALRAHARAARLRTGQIPLADVPAPLTPAHDLGDVGPALDEEINRLPDHLRAPLVLCCPLGTVLRKHFIVVDCPFPNLNGVSFGVSLYAHTGEGRLFHSYRWGTGNCLIGRLYTLKAHTTRVKEVVAFLEESVKKHKEAAKPLTPGREAGKGMTRVEPVQKWSGVLKDESLRKVSPWGPTGSVLTQQRDFDQVWRKWRPDEKVPKIDFIKNLVVVVTSAGGYPVTAVPQRSAKGDLKLYSWAEVSAATGFGYQIAVLPRKGIRTFRGHRLDCGRPYCCCHHRIDPGYAESTELINKLHGVCWGDLAQHECFKDDKEEHKKVLDAAYADAAKSRKLLLYVANTDNWAQAAWKACLAEPAVLKLLKKEFIVVSVPFRNLNDCPVGVKAHAYTPDRKLLHSFNWGTARRFPGIYREWHREANMKVVKTFLQGCLKKKAAAKADE